MKPLLIGEAPSKNESPERPIEGRIGRRLAACCGLPYDEFLNHFERVNLLHERQDTAEHGFVFDSVAAMREAQNMKALFAPGRIVLLLGLRVGAAFGCRFGYFVKWWIHDAEAYVIPHPSGINRWHNDLANAAKLKAFMREIVERTR